MKKYIIYVSQIALPEEVIEEINKCFKHSDANIEIKEISRENGANYSNSTITFEMTMGD